MNRHWYQFGQLVYAITLAIIFSDMFFRPIVPHMLINPTPTDLMMVNKLLDVCFLSFIGIFGTLGLTCIIVNSFTKEN